MKKTIKIWSSILLVVFVIFLLIMYINFLYKSHNPNEIVKEEKQTILIYNSLGEEEEKNALLNNIIDEYANNKNIKINNISLSDVEFYKKLNMDLVTVNSPDIIITRPDKRIEDLFLEGKIYSFNQEFKNDVEWYSNFDKSALRLISNAEDVFGIPMSIEHYALFYNVEIFKQLGLKPPKNLEELEYIVKILNSNNIIPFAYSADDDSLFQAILASVSDSAVINSGLNNDNVFYFSKAMEIMKNLYQNNSFPEKFEVLSKSEAMNLFCEDNAAMYVGGADFIKYVEEYNKNYEGIYDTENRFDVNFFPDLDGDGVRTNTLVFDVGELTAFVLNKDTKKHDEIMSFVKYLTSEKTAVFLYSNTKNKSAIKNVDSLYKKKQLETNYRILENYSMEFIRMPKSIIDGYIWGEYLMGKMTDVMKGNADSELVCLSAVKMQNSIN